MSRKARWPEQKFLNPAAHLRTQEDLKSLNLLVQATGGETELWVSFAHVSNPWSSFVEITARKGWAPQGVWEIDVNWSALGSVPVTDAQWYSTMFQEAVNVATVLQNKLNCCPDGRAYETNLDAIFLPCLKKIAKLYPRINQ